MHWDQFSKEPEISQSVGTPKLSAGEHASAVRNPDNSDGEKCKTSNSALVGKSSSPTTRVDNKSLKIFSLKDL